MLLMVVGDVFLSKVKSKMKGLSSSTARVESDSETFSEMRKVVVESAYLCTPAALKDAEYRQSAFGALG